MLSQEKLLGLIGRIYDAAADENLWPAFLGELAGALDATSTVILYHDMKTLRANFVIGVRVDPTCEQRYLNYYSGIDPYKSASLAKLNRIGPESAYIGEELIELVEVRKTEYYNDFAVKYDIAHHICAPLIHGRDWSSNVSCHRSSSKGPFGQEDLELLQLVFPHLQRAIQLHCRFAEMEGRHRATLSALDNLTVGIILLDERGRPLATNREADRIFRQSDGLSLHKNGIGAARADETRELLETIAKAAKTATGPGIQPGGIVAIQRPSGRMPLTVLIAPVSREYFAKEAGTPSVVLIVTDPERNPEPLAGCLSRLYALTTAESRIAELLMQGETVVRLAERLGVSHNTARTHLQRIYQKTNTSHQGELVRLLISSTGHLQIRR